MAQIDVKNIRFTIVRSHNTPNIAELGGGLRAYRSEFVEVESYGRVACAPYDNHFVFLDPTPANAKNPRWFALCSCGGPAVIIGTQAYSHLGSPQGWMLVCWSHTTYGKHWDGSS